MTTNKKKTAKAPKVKKTSALSRTQPGTNKSPTRPGLFRAGDLKWKDGSGAFRGVQVAVVSEDPETGAKAMFLRIPANKTIDLRTEYHYHTQVTHSFVIEGSTMSEVNGRRMIAKAGDYFRAPANWIHAHAGSDSGAIVFMVIEGNRVGKQASRFNAVAAEQ